MAENLKVTHYRNGDAIPNVIEDADWSSLSTGAYCLPYNNEELAETYGYLYNWFAVDDNRDIAPEGWHVPTDDEWKELEISLGMSESEVDSSLFRGTDEGGKLKESGTEHWASPNTGATNESGFTALPTGGRYAWGPFLGLGEIAGFWCARMSSENYDSRLIRTLYYDHSDIDRATSPIGTGLSVRLVRD